MDVWGSCTYLLPPAAVSWMYNTMRWNLSEIASSGGITIRLAETLCMIKRVIKSSASQIFVYTEMESKSICTVVKSTESIICILALLVQQMCCTHLNSSLLSMEEPILALFGHWIHAAIHPFMLLPMLYFPELLLLLQWQSLLLSNQPQQLPESDDEIISHPRPAQLNPAGNPGWRITELNNPKIMEIGKDLQDHQVEPSTHHNHAC